MRIAVIALLAGLVAGCATQQPALAPVAEPRDATLAPAGPAEGRITVVNADHKFVVVDFGSFSVPAVGSEARVFRGEQIVGKVRLTEPRRGRMITGDVLEGDPKAGDVVRPADRMEIED